jgi:hypothetical protein
VVVSQRPVRFVSWPLGRLPATYSDRQPSTLRGPARAVASPFRVSRRGCRTDRVDATADRLVKES